MMRPMQYFSEPPDEIAVRVAVQMGISLEEAWEQMEMFDRMAIETFRVGNDYPRSELH